MPNPLHAVADAFEGLLEHLYVHAILRPSFRGAADLHEKIEGVRKMAFEMDDHRHRPDSEYTEANEPVAVADDHAKPPVEDDKVAPVVAEVATTGEPVIGGISIEEAEKIAV